MTSEEQDWLAARFEEQRTHLRGVAYRILGSMSEADDAVQESWIRLSRANAGGVENLGRWLTTVVSRVCLDMLRARRSRREAPLEVEPDPIATADDTGDPEHQAVVADSIGIALLVVLETLTPAERVAFVLHDLFAVPFDEIAPIVERSPAAARQLASRARRRVQGAQPAIAGDRARQHEVVTAFLAASRGGDFEALLAILDPDVVLRADPAAVLAGATAEVRGARDVASALSGRVRGARPALVDNAPGVVLEPGAGRPRIVFAFRIAEGRITAVEMLADPVRLAQLPITFTDNKGATPMHPQVTVVMLGVKDLERSKRFYGEGLGIPIAQDYPGFVRLDLGDGSSDLALYPWDAAAGDAGASPEGSGFRGFSLHYIVPSAERVDEVLAQAAKAGGTIARPAERFQWGYSGYFADPDGHLWKVATS